MSLTIQTKANEYGISVITITVTDENYLSNSSSFTITVMPQNDAPYISNPDNIEIKENTTTEAIPFTITDIDNSTESLTISVVSSNIELVTNNDIQLNGTGTDRHLTITPQSNKFGTTIITISISDGYESDSVSFTLTVNQIFYSISGKVTFYNNGLLPVPNVIMNLIGSQTYTTSTDSNGYYTINNVISGNYILNAEKTDDLKGLSSLDASRIARNVVGLYTLDRYKINSLFINNRELLMKFLTYFFFGTLVW